MEHPECQAFELSTPFHEKAATDGCFCKSEREISVLGRWA